MSSRSERDVIEITENREVAVVDEHATVDDISTYVTATIKKNFIQGATKSSEMRLKKCCSVGRKGGIRNFKISKSRCLEKLLISSSFRWVQLSMDYLCGSLFHNIPRPQDLFKLYESLYLEVREDISGSNRQLGITVVKWFLSPSGSGMPAQWMINAL